MKKVSSIITSDDVITKTSTPDNIRLYAPDVHGHKSFIEAAMDLLNGKVVKYAICSRNPEGSGNPPKIEQIMTFKVPKNLRCVRFCGSDDNPLYGGSSTFWGSIEEKGEITQDDLMDIAVSLAFTIGNRGYWVFKMEIPEVK